ncbi:MAG: ribbon-helix-helix protein, CopG family [Planctomycetes bacterium]|nr:ribbon-helix-helix protein, CopG family [Planctomycetota bacterium]
MTNAIHNLHVPLPAELYAALRDEARRAGRPATQVAREAISQWLEEERRARLRRDIEAYARSAAGTTHDLEPALERAAAEQVLGGATSKRGRRA